MSLLTILHPIVQGDDALNGLDHHIELTRGLPAPAAKYKHLFVEHDSLLTLASVTMPLNSGCRRNHAACYAAEHLVCLVENARIVLQSVEMASAARP